LRKLHKAHPFLRLDHDGVWCRVCKGVRSGGTAPLVHRPVPYFTRDRDRKLVPLIGGGGGEGGDTLGDAVRAHVDTDEYARAHAAWCQQLAAAPPALTVAEAVEDVDA